MSTNSICFSDHNMANVIYKDNNLIEASYALTLSEQRLILVAIIAAREIEKELTSDTLLSSTTQLNM